MTQGSPYRAAVVKRRPPPGAPPAGAKPARSVRATPAAPSAAERAAEIAAEHARRVAVETAAVHRIETMTRAWNDELSSTVPAVASVVSRAVRTIVGEAPREDVVMNALRREVSRVRGDHRPVLRVPRDEAEAWIGRLRERARDAEPAFDVRTDDALAPGKCVLEIGARRVELTPEAQLDAFDIHLRNGVGALAPRPAPALPDAPAPAGAADEPIVVAQPDRKDRPSGRSGRIAPRTLALESASPPLREDVPSDGTPTGKTDATPEDRSAGDASPVAVGRNGASDEPRSAATVRVKRPAREPARKVEAVAVAADDGGNGDEAKRVAPSAPVASFPANGERDRRSESTDRVPSAADVAAGAGSTRSGSPRPEASAEGSSATSPTPPDDGVDLDALDLGAGAARYESGPAIEQAGSAPWIGSVVAAPALAKVGIEGGGSRAVAALRERVARTAGDLREEVVRAAEIVDLGTDDTSVSADNVVEKRRADVTKRTVGPLPDGTGRSVAKAPIAEKASEEPTTETAPSASLDTPADPFPPFVHSGREVGPAASRSARGSGALDHPDDDTSADRIVAGGDGEAIRRVLAGVRKRAPRPEAVSVGRSHGSVRADAREDDVEGGDARTSRLPPRIAELIAKRRSAR